MRSALLRNRSGVTITSEVTNVVPEIVWLNPVEAEFIVQTPVGLMR